MTPEWAVRCVEIRVIGLPAPQGSKRHVGHGVMIESSKAVKPWREAVKWATLETRSSLKSAGEEDHIAGPVAVEMVFTMPRPKSAKNGAVPAKRPDLSKLVRSTEDSLTDVGVWEDDSRVVECVARKVYPGQHCDALPVPGALIRIRGLVTDSGRGR